MPPQKWPLEHWLVIAAITAALLLPMLVFQRGLTFTPLLFRDQISHLLRLDHSMKAELMRPGLADEPWLRNLNDHRRDAFRLALFEST